MSFGIYTILPIRTSWIVRKGSWTMTRQWEPVTSTSDVVTENPDVAVTLYASAFRHAAWTQLALKILVTRSRTAMDNGR